MRRVNVSSVLTAVLAGLLVGFWSWVLITPNSVPDCPSRPTAGIACLTPTPVRVDTVLPLMRYVQGLRNPIGPNYGVPVSGLSGGVRTVYLDGSGMAQLDPQPGQHWEANPGLRNLAQVRPPAQGLWIDVRKPRR